MSFFKNKKPTKPEILKFKKYLSEAFTSLGWLKGRAAPLIGIGGSARNLVQIHQNLVDYPLAGLHQYFMTGQEIKHVAYFLRSFSPDELEKVDGLSKDRTDTIIPATLTFLNFI